MNAYQHGYQLAADFGEAVEIGDWHWAPGMRSQSGYRLTPVYAAFGAVVRYATEPLVWVADKDALAPSFALDAIESPVPDLSDEMTLGAAKAMGELL